MKIKILLGLIILLGILLRIFQIGNNPPSLYWDEASLGYNAYSILTSGHDEHGEFLPIARFIAFGDYKPPGYIYAAVLSIYLFGLTEPAVRFPSAVGGILMIVVTYFLVKELFNKKKLALLAAFLLSISPWAIHFSRAAFEANLAALLNLFGVYFFVLSKRKKSMLILSVISFILSFYTFNANRIIAPLMLISLSAIYYKSLRFNIKWLVISIFFAVIMIWPSFSYFSNRESKLRFQEVSIFNDFEPINISNERINLDEGTLWAKLLHNRRMLFASSFFKHYFDNFTGRFLFTYGDVNPRLNAQEMGQLYVWDLPFMLAGLLWLLRKREKSLLLLILWMAISPIPAATARETPHALRILSILPVYQIIIAYGLYQMNYWIRYKYTLIKKYILLSVFCSLLTVNCFYYLHNYYIHYPREWNGEWQYGYKQMVQYVSNVEERYDNIFVTEALGRPYIYFAFYQAIPNNIFLKKRVASRDWFGFWTVSVLGKIKFGFDELSRASGRILLVTTPGKLPDNYRLLDTIYNIKSEKIFEIAEKL